MTTETPTAASSGVTRLWNKNYFLLWQGQLLSQFGVQANHIALMFWIKHTTDSATLMGTLLMAATLPSLLLEPIGGVVADFASRKKIIVFTDCLSGFSVLVLGITMLLAPEQHSLLLVLMFVSVSLTNACQAFFRPAATAAIPDLVPTGQLAAANSFGQSSAQFAILIGNGTGGILYRLLGAPLLFVIDGVSYLYAGISEIWIDLPERKVAKAAGIKEALEALRLNFVTGASFFWNHHGMRAFFGMYSLNSFFIVPCVVMLPFFVEDHLKLSPDWYGYFLAVNGVGMIVGFLSAGILTVSSAQRPQVVLSAFFLVAVLVIVFGNTTHVGLAGTLVAAIGLLEGYINVVFVTLVQESVPADMRGRVFGIIATVSGAATPIAMGLSGIVTDKIGRDMPLLYSSCGIALTVLTAMVALSRPLREFLASEIQISEAVA